MKRLALTLLLLLLCSPVVASAQLVMIRANSSDPAVPTLPQVTPRSTPPTGWDGTADVVLTSSDNLQSAINAADTSSGVYIIELTAGDTWTGEFVIGPEDATGGGWLVIRSSAHASLPALGTCLGAAPSHNSNLANIVGSSSSPYRALKISASSDGTGGAAKVAIIGLSFTPNTSVNPAEFIVFNRDGSDEFPDDAADVVEDIVVWHCRVTTGTNRSAYVGLSPNGNNISLLDLDFRVHGNGSNPGADGSTGIRWYNGIGTLIDDCLFTTASPGIFLSDNSQIGLQQPTDVTIRNCTLTTDPTWIGVEKHKNRFEAKGYERVLIENTLFEYSWSDAQDGTAVVVKNNSAYSLDFTMRNCKIAKCQCPILVQGRDDEVPIQMERVLFDNVLCTEISEDDYGGGFGGEGLWPSFTEDSLYVTLDHVTCVVDDGAAKIRLHPNSLDREHLKLVDCVFALASGTPGGIVAVSGSAGEGVPDLNDQCTAYDLQFNAFQGLNISNYDNHGSIEVGSTCDNNYFPASFAAIGFNNAAAGDYSIPSGTYSTASSTGGPLGFIAGDTIGVNE